MGTTWVGALARAAAALGRRRSVHEGEESDVTDESGFTLIELMVVLLIMGILMAIAIPTFLGVTSTANDTSTQSNLTNVITTAKAIYSRADTYPTTTKMVAQLTGGEPTFGYTAGVSAKQHTISVKTGTLATGNTKLVLAAYMTKTHECWVAVVTDGSTPSVKYGYVKPTGTAKTVPSTKCIATVLTATLTTSTKWPLAPAGH